MKIRQLLLIIISLAFAFEASAQSCHVVYSYDSAGNRVQQFKVSPVPWAAVDDSVMRDRIDSAQLPGKALARIDASIKLSAVAVPLMHEEERIQPAWVLPCWKQDKYSVYSLFFSTVSPSAKSTSIAESLRTVPSRISRARRLTSSLCIRRFTGRAPKAGS